MESKLEKYLKEEIYDPQNQIEGYKEQKTVKCCRGCKFGVIGYDDEHTCDNPDNIGDNEEIDVDWYGICPKFKASDVTI